MQPILVHEIFSKLRTKEDKINYFLEQGTIYFFNKIKQACIILIIRALINFFWMYYPEKKVKYKLYHITLSFGLQLLNLGNIGGYQLPYYTKEQILTKKMIFQIFTVDQNLLKYLSDNPKLDAIPREYLLSILANIKRVEYENKYIKLKF